MSPEAIAFWGLVANIIGVFIAALALVFVGRQVLYAARTADVAAMNEAVREYRAVMDDFKKPGDIVGKMAGVMNFMELQAAAINAGLYGKVTRRKMAERVCGMLAEIEALEAARDLVQETIDGDDTYADLRLFIKRHRRLLDRTRQAVKAKMAEAAEKQPPP